MTQFKQSLATTAFAITAVLAIGALPATPAAAQQKQSANPAKSDKVAAKAAPEISVLRDRIEQLEEKVDDMDVIIATLESMVKAGGGRRPASTYQQPQQPQTSALPPLRGTQPDPAYANAPATGGFGQTTVTPNRGVAPLPRYGEQSRQPQSGQGQFVQPQQRQPQRRPQPKPKENGGFDWFGFGKSSNELQPKNPASRPPQQVAGYQATDAAVKDYERAYGFMLQQDYLGAESAFRNFLGQHRTSSLAGNAYFWLGEAYYEQKRFREAASSFLTGYRQYKSGQRAADSMLKLAISLNAMGEKGQACATLLAIPNEFPRAPAHIRRRMDREQKSIGCS